MPDADCMGDCIGCGFGGGGIHAYADHMEGADESLIQTAQMVQESAICGNRTLYSINLYSRTNSIAAKFLQIAVREPGCLTVNFVKQYKLFE